MKNKSSRPSVLNNIKHNLVNALDLTRLTARQVLILVLLTFAFPMQADGQTSDSSIKIMTFNIRYGTADDGEDSWQFRRENVFKVIKNAEPDLIGLQESLGFQNEEILKEFSQYALIGVGRDDGNKAGEFSPILYNKERFTVDTMETFWFSETPKIRGSKHWGNYITRICSWAILTDKLTGKKFYHYNLHIDHESQPSREKSTAMLVKKIAEQVKKYPIILTGDFNCGDTNPAVQNVLNAGLIDTYRALNAKSNEEGTFNSFKGETNGEKIDFIFVSKEFACKVSEIIRTSFGGKYPSDHFPVSALVKW